MILKLMGPESASDSDTRKTFRLLCGVSAVDFGRSEVCSASYADVTFNDGETERYNLNGNAYVMNDSGKTISAFGVAVIPEGNSCGASR